MNTEDYVLIGGLVVVGYLVYHEFKGYFPSIEKTLKELSERENVTARTPTTVYIREGDTVYGVNEASLRGASMAEKAMLNAGWSVKSVEAISEARSFPTRLTQNFIEQVSGKTPAGENWLKENWFTRTLRG